MAPNDIPLWTVTQLTAQVKGVLEESFFDVWVVGEISNLKPAGSGHLYFNLKDRNAILRTVMWRSDVPFLRFKPQEGMEVVVRGRLTVYPPRGDYQLTVNRMIQRGEGEHDRALRQLKEKLQKLGYFAAERKRPIPSYPRRLALVTSPTGAAIRDMLEILGRRWPHAEVLVCAVRVQGAGAALDMVRALEHVGAMDGIDVILLGRGGGSSEDLAAFNDEKLAQAIFASRVPIISAVGHEIDVTIADLVADRRALTPSEAAEIATPDRAKVLRELTERADRLHNLLRGRLQFAGKRLHDLASRRVLRQPLERIREEERRLDECKEKLDRGVLQRLARSKLAIENRVGRLQSLSPLNVLARGYSLIRTDTDRHIVRSAQQVEEGQRLEVLLQDGRLLVRVDGKLPPDPRLQAEAGTAHE